MSKYIIVIRIVKILLAWYEDAAKDKVITDDEIAKLLTEIARATDFKINL